jgi:DNA (cytosine-5)-methyltransferase 1
VIYGSVCSGIEAATVAWHPLGWKPAWFSEIEKFPSAVLNHHYPRVPNLGDMTKLHDNETFRNTRIDLLVGGTPCQSFSVAGLRKGLDDPRGNLALEFLRLVDIKLPEWFVWENVPGVLSSSGGRDFGSFLGAIQKLGYGFAYRILDAQFFGVPQRRRRVFVVGHLGNWRPAAAVLFECESLLGNSSSGRKKGKGTSSYTTNSFGSYREGFGTLRGSRGDLGGGSEVLIPTYWDGEITAGTLTTERAGQEKYSSVLVPRVQTTEAVLYPSCTVVHQNDHFVGPEGSAQTLPAQGGNNSPCGNIYYGPIFGVSGDETPKIGHNLNPSLRSERQGAVAFQSSQSGTRLVDAHATLDSHNDSRRHNGVVNGTQVRRLTPRECERLQGFPDDYTLIPMKKQSDGPRYKALGNSMAVPCMYWIGRRIELVHNMNIF